MNDPKENEAARDAAPLQKGGVRFAVRELAEVDDRSHPVLRIPRERIQRIHLRRGLQAARPALQLALGGVCLVAGVVLELVLLGSWFREGGTLHLEMVGGFLCLALAGGWLTSTALRKGYYLEVQTARGMEKVRIERGLAPRDIEAFLVEARDRLGYEVSDLQILYSEPAGDAAAS
jgi:hypothetical protein